MSLSEVGEPREAYDGQPWKLRASDRRCETPPLVVFAFKQVQHHKSSICLMSHGVSTLSLNVQGEIMFT